MAQATTQETICIRSESWGVTYSAKGLCRLYFPPFERVSTVSADPSPWSPMVRSWLEAYWETHLRRPSSPLPPLDLESGTPFQQAVWRALLKIPFGTRLSYRELAAKMGSPNAARAVGSACGRNPIPLLIPCHRVVASSGGLGGFSAGLKWKERLLQWEALQAESSWACHHV